MCFFSRRTSAQKLLILSCRVLKSEPRKPYIMCSSEQTTKRLPFSTSFFFLFFLKLFGSQTKQVACIEFCVGMVGKGFFFLLRALLSIPPSSSFALGAFFLLSVVAPHLAKEPGQIASHPSSFQTFQCGNLSFRMLEHLDP